MKTREDILAKLNYLYAKIDEVAGYIASAEARGWDMRADSLTDDLIEYEAKRDIMDYLGLFGASPSIFEYYTANSTGGAIEIEGFSQLIGINENYGGSHSSVVMDSTSVRIKSHSVDEKFDLTEIISHVVSRADSLDNNVVTFQPAELSIDARKSSARLVIDYMYFSRIDRRAYELRSIRGYLLIRDH